MAAEFFAAVRGDINCEQIRTLQRLYAGSVTPPTERVLAQLVAARLASVGPPPMLDPAISYRGRHELRLVEDAQNDRDRFAGSLKAGRVRIHVRMKRPAR